MRLVVKIYEQGSMYVAETPNDGSSEKVLLGGRAVGERISVYMEVMADENEQGADRVVQATQWLQGEMSKRKQVYTRKKAVKKRKLPTKKI